jgi:hypothetical protein
VHFLLGQGSARQLASAAAEGVKERALRIADQVRAGNVGRQNPLNRVMAGHGVMLATRLVHRLRWLMAVSLLLSLRLICRLPA